MVMCSLLVVAGCARQDTHSIRVAHQGGQEFAVEDCEKFTSVVHEIAGDYRLEETRGVADRDSFPRYRDYWSKASPIGLDLYCDSNMLQVTVTAVRRDRRDPSGKIYKQSIADLSSAIGELFGSGIKQDEDSILVRTW